MTGKCFSDLALPALSLMFTHNKDFNSTKRWWHTVRVGGERFILSEPVLIPHVSEAWTPHPQFMSARFPVIPQ